MVEVATRDDGDAVSPEHFRVELSEPTAGALLGGAASVAVELAAPSPCVVDANTLCLLGDRFRARAQITNQYANVTAPGQALVHSDLTGFLYLGDARNPELAIKLLDFGDRVLFLSGAMSNLQYTIRVRELATGREQVYENLPGRFCGFLDAAAF